MFCQLLWGSRPQIVRIGRGRCTCHVENQMLVAILIPIFTQVTGMVENPGWLSEDLVLWFVFDTRSCYRRCRIRHQYCPRLWDTHSAQQGPNIIVKEIQCQRLLLCSPNPLNPGPEPKRLRLSELKTDQALVMRFCSTRHSVSTYQCIYMYLSIYLSTHLSIFLPAYS